MKIARLWVLVCLAGFAVGCGQKGPLVLPDAPKHKKAQPSQHTPAPAAAPAPAGTDSATDTPKP